MGFYGIRIVMIMNTGWQRFFTGFLTGIFVLIVFLGGAAADRLAPLPFLNKLVPARSDTGQGVLQQKVLNEESVVIDVAEKVSPGVVTVSVRTERNLEQPFFLDPFGFFRVPGQGRTETVQQDIGTGFVVSREGLIVTNKHVVADPSASYSVFLKDGSEQQVQQIWRDPLNDLAIISIGSTGLTPLELGDSSNLQVGQFVIAIGTALGEFRHTVTTGVISGLGRGITAGDTFGGFVEKLENVIQTDAAINPGNSGGPLLNSAGQVIGVNVAVSQNAQNVGFAIPINVIKESLTTFNQTGQFNRPFLGVKYRELAQNVAVLNNLPSGAYVVEVMAGSPAEEAGVKVQDVITKFDGKSVGEEEGGLARMILSKKIGERVTLDVYRGGEVLSLSTTMKGSQ